MVLLLAPQTLPEALLQQACLQAAAREGQMSTLRVLIQFIGIGIGLEKNGAPKRFVCKRSTDARIDQLPGGELFPIDGRIKEATFLAKLADDLSKASSHLTANSGHGEIGRPQLEAGFRIVRDHLLETIYRGDKARMTAALVAHAGLHPMAGQALWRAGGDVDSPGPSS